MTPAQELRSSIVEKQAERTHLIEQLALWADVKGQGIAIDSVQCFGFDPSLLTPVQKMAARRAAMLGQLDPVTGERATYNRFGRLYPGAKLPNGHFSCEVFNYVRHHDGSQTILNPMLKAV